MTLPVRLTSAAVRDLALAERWYLDEAPHVLASFEEEIDKVFSLISERPELYRTVESRNRSMRTFTVRHQGHRRATDHWDRSLHHVAELRRRRWGAWVSTPGASLR